jgi:hypothetical protein
VKCKKPNLYVLKKIVLIIRPQSGILILVAIWPSTPKIWWPSSNFSDQRKEKLVAKDKVKAQK